MSRRSPPSLSVLALSLLALGPVAARAATGVRIGGQPSSTVECAGGALGRFGR